MIQCLNCSHYNSDTARFCVDCGTAMPHLCHVCNFAMAQDAVTCSSCGFDQPGTATMRALSHPLIPSKAQVRLLSRLNAYTKAEDLARDVELLGEEDTGAEVAGKILKARDELGGFETVDQVESLHFLGASRFTELVLALAVDVHPLIPDLSQGDVQPTTPRFSSSSTDIDMSYRLLAGGLIQHESVGAVVARVCSTCAAFAPSFNHQLGTPEAQVEITGLVLDGSTDEFDFAITMDMRMQPYDWMHPLDKTAQQFQFPAKMQLNNSMIIKLRPKGSNEILKLVSRDVPCQAGRITNWPPYRMRLHSQRKITYFNEADPMGNPVLEILDATTYLTGPDAFFAHRADITEYEYVESKGIRDLPAVKLTWRPMPKGEPNTERLTHYYVYRSANPTFGKRSWTNVSGRVVENTWIDPNPPRGPLYYRVVPVMTTILGDDYEGFPGQDFRVEPLVSVFRV